MAGRLEGKSIAITGAGRGIGRATALRLAGEGARVVVADYGGPVDTIGTGSQGPADEVVAAIHHAGGEAIAVYDDVATIPGGERVVQAAVDSFGRLDGLVCCAGIIGPRRPLWELSEDEWDAVVRVHLKGHFCSVRAAIPVMMEQRSGRLVFFSSNASIAAPTAGIGPGDAGPYGAAKAGVLGLMWGIAATLKGHGITANAIFPGAATRMIDHILRAGDRDAGLESEHAVGTWRDPTNVSPIIAYLLSDAGASVNGQIFGLIGGRLSHFRGVEPRNVLQSEDRVGFSIDELFRRFPAELGADHDYDPVPWPPPVGDYSQLA